MPEHAPDHLAPARYVPFISGRYEVAPGLFKFGRDWGNGAADEHIFQIDREFDHYRSVKLASRAESLDRYYATDGLSDDVAARAIRFMVDRLLLEHPDRFTAAFASAFPRTLDDVALLVQEDVAIVSTADDRHWLSAIHLCFPNHWAARDKIGRDFATIHAPVAGIESINRNAASIVQIMLNARDGLVRFAWGMATDDDLNHHPSRPASRSFDPARPRAFVRVERQTIWGFPDVGAALFTIRTSSLNCADIRRNPVECAALCSAIRSMSRESLSYKGLASWRDDLLAWLESSDKV